MKEKTKIHFVSSSTNNTPKHIAVIMDGNRRFAKTILKKSVAHGHMAGFKKLSEVIIWCRLLKVKILTCYAFSVENFKRSDEEVEILMNMLKDKLTDIDNKKEELVKNNIQVNIVGELTKLPLKIQNIITSIHESSTKYPEVTLNICIGSVF